MRKIVVMLVVLLLSLTIFAETIKDDTVKYEAGFISYHGKISKIGGRDFENGTYIVNFKLYTENSEKEVWSEIKELELSNGIINTNLGDSKTFDPGMFNKKLYLALEIAGKETEKQLLTGTPYSMIARRVSEDAIVGGQGITVNKLEDGKLEIAGELSESNSGAKGFYGDDRNFCTGGSNSWVLSTPDDGREDMFIKNTDMPWPSTQVAFYKEGDVAFSKKVGIGISPPPNNTGFKPRFSTIR